MNKNISKFTKALEETKTKLVSFKHALPELKKHKIVADRKATKEEKELKAYNEFLCNTFKQYLLELKPLIIHEKYFRLQIPNITEEESIEGGRFYGCFNLKYDYENLDQFTYHHLANAIFFHCDIRDIEQAVWDFDTYVAQEYKERILRNMPDFIKHVLEKQDETIRTGGKQ